MGRGVRDPLGLLLHVALPHGVSDDRLQPLPRHPERHRDLLRIDTGHRTVEIIYAQGNGGRQHKLVAPITGLKTI